MAMAIVGGLYDHLVGSRFTRPHQIPLADQTGQGSTDFTIVFFDISNLDINLKNRFLIIAGLLLNC